MNLWRQMNILNKYGGRSVRSFPLKVKLLETSKRTPAVCAVFIVSPSHQYSTFQNEKTQNAKLLLNRRLLAANITSYGLLSTDDASKVQGVLADTAPRDYYATERLTDGSVTKSPGDPHADPGVSSTGLSASDHVESVLPSESVSEFLALTPDVTSVLDNAEVPLSALGLAGWTPVGLIRWCIELLHVNLDIPWWAAIVTATFIARVLLFPLVIKGQRNAVELGNTMPQLQVLQQKFHKARCSGDSMQAAKCGMEMQLFMEKHKINPLKSVLVPLLQAPVFVSFFLGLRSMAKLPVESFKTGGIWWLTDLTIPDPYYITPVLTCATLFVVLKIGADGGMRMEHMKMAKYLLMGLPVILLPITINFPAAVVVYWFANNVFTLGTVSILRIEGVREACKIPKRKPFDTKNMSPKKGFVAGVKEAYQDHKILGAMSERDRMDAVRFRKAGMGPIPRTYSYDPTKPGPAAAAAARQAQAKEYKP